MPTQSKNRQTRSITVEHFFTTYRERLKMEVVAGEKGLHRSIREQAKGGPGWAYANSGAMLSGQDPKSMGLKQSFPNSLEFQFLAQDKSVKPHVVQSTGLALPLGEWVVAEAIVKDGKIQHLINGKVVKEYTHPKFDDGTPVTHGWISLQAESHPCQFRKAETLVLD